jgi:hypothetical protein
MQFSDITRFRVIIYVFVFTLSIESVVAQTNAVSPLTVFGFGDLSEGYFAQNFGIGGNSIAVREPLYINVANPASYSALEYTTLEMAFSHRFIQQTVESTNQSLLNQSTYFNYFSLGFKLKEWWGTGLSLMPYSFVGYNINTVDSLADFGKVEYKFIGQGGINQVVWGNSFQILKHLSVGINARYLFGSYDKSESASFQSTQYYNAKRLTSTGVSSFTTDYGIQYTLPLGNYSLTIGGVYANTVDLNAIQSTTNYTFLINSSGSEVPVDTLSAVLEEPGTVTLPSRLGIGFQFGKKNPDFHNYAWMVSGELSQSKWSEFRDYEGDGGLNDSWRLAMGTYFVPVNAFSGSKRGKSYLANIEYRFGGFYENTYVELDDKSILNYGATMGFGLPIGYRNLAPGEKKSTIINFGIVVGYKGNGLPTQLNEQYVNLLFGITLGDQWFQKFKYR